MPDIKVEDVIGPCAITLFSSIQMASFAKRVGMARSKYKIQPPATDGDENFVRVYRAHQNSVEFYPLFLGGLWSGSLMLHQTPACIFGMVYLVGRQKYFNGYSESTDKRMSGFRLSLIGLQGLWLCSILGLVNQGFVAYSGKSVMKFFKSLC
eukprot:Seg1691.5 transcript_id=Seg1691.5/GoldUCD/mRNA.D3Y31 product="Microsomal glutathione S-transferase 2" protein_id=Seg1691.5/GoldUCD/D3Y31